MRGLVTFTLFGDEPLYTVGALKNVDIWDDSPFDVVCRFYCGKTVPAEVKRGLELKGTQVIEVVDYPEDQTATFWRYDAFRDSSYDYYLSRDVDSRPYEREFYAIDEFLKSDKSFHIIRDHPFHGVPILAGLFGLKSEVRDLVAGFVPFQIPEDFYTHVNKVQTAEHFLSNDFYQVDQWWLRLRLYPALENHILAHDGFFGFERRRTRAFLPERDGDDFIGEGFDEHDRSRYPEHRGLLADWLERLR